MKNNVEYMIALNIIKAQIASDAGKGLYRLNLKNTDGYKKLGYQLKETAIVTAIKLIRTNKTEFNYWVQEAPDQNNNNSIIVYFDFKLNGTRYQVSFHNHGVKELRDYLNTGRKTHWRKAINSLESCKALKNYYNMSEEKIFEYIYDKNEFDYLHNKRNRGFRDENRRSR